MTGTGADMPDKWGYRTLSHLSDFGVYQAHSKFAKLQIQSLSFLASFEWASDNAYPEIVALTEEVITGGGFGHLPPQHGRRWIKDRAQLIGCGLLLVLIMMVIVAICGLIFQKK